MLPTKKQQPTLTILKDGTKEWRLNGKLHREDGPAIEYADGTKEWRLNDELHREDGPAIEWKDGTTWWGLNGEFHREDGPAIEYADGTKRWFIHGKLHREDGPAIEKPDGTKWWILNSRRIYSCPPTIKDKAVGDVVEVEGQLGIIFKKGVFIHIQLDEKEMVFVND